MPGFSYCQTAAHAGRRDNRELWRPGKRWDLGSGHRAWWFVVHNLGILAIKYRCIENAKRAARWRFIENITTLDLLWLYPQPIATSVKTGEHEKHYKAYNGNSGEAIHERILP